LLDLTYTPCEPLRSHVRQRRRHRSMRFQRMFTLGDGLTRQRKALGLTGFALLGQFFPRDYTGVCVG
jgi:hypothetical protein